MLKQLLIEEEAPDTTQEKKSTYNIEILKKDVVDRISKSSSYLSEPHVAEMMSSVLLTILDNSATVKPLLAKYSSEQLKNEQFRKRAATEVANRISEILKNSYGIKSE